MEHINTLVSVANSLSGFFPEYPLLSVIFQTVARVLP